MVRLPFPGGHSPGSGMGHFRVSIQVGRRGGERFAPLDALVDTGATYTWVPGDVLEGVGVAPEEERPFVLADGREVHYPVAWAQLRIGAREQPTIVVFGNPGSEPILGAVTLEEFLLAVDLVGRRLISVPGLLKAVQTSSVRIGWRVRRKGSKTRPRISSVTTPSSASASPGWPSTTGVWPSPWKSASWHSETGRQIVVPSARTNSTSRLGSRPMARHTGSGRSE